MKIDWVLGASGAREPSRKERGVPFLLPIFTGPSRCRAANFPLSLPNACHTGYVATKM